MVPLFTVMSLCDGVLRQLVHVYGVTYSMKLKSLCPSWPRRCHSSCHVAHGRLPTAHSRWQSSRKGPPFQVPPNLVFHAVRPGYFRCVMRHRPFLERRLHRRFKKERHPSISLPVSRKCECMRFSDAGTVLPHDTPLASTSSASELLRDGKTIYCKFIMI